MSLLYPRLLPSETAALFNGLQGLSLAQLETASQTKSDRAVFAASGGTRVSPDFLATLRDQMSISARSAGYPEAPTPISRATFDNMVARTLHSVCDMAPGEAAQPQVWAFMALILLPHVCAWRFPADANGRYVADRFKGTDLTRHALGRLWTRAHVLKDDSSEASADPYRLLGVMGEADLDQIMARRDSVAACPALVRAVVRVHAESLKGAALPARQLLREVLMRLLRLTAFIDFDGYSERELQRVVLRLRAEALQAAS